MLLVIKNFTEILTCATKEKEDMYFFFKGRQLIF